MWHNLLSLLKPDDVSGAIKIFKVGSLGRPNVMVTGANGLIGRALCARLSHEGVALTKVVRLSTDDSEFSVGEIDENTDWSAALCRNTEVVVHLAARVPDAENEQTSDGNYFISTNTLGTVNLARECVRAKVKRFVFLSTAKVLGSISFGEKSGYSFKQALDNYSLSKLRAELELWNIAAETGMEVVVIRPPLVYGPGVKGNFLRLMKAVNRCYPLPFGAIENSRSMIYLENLIDAIELCLTHPAAAGATFSVSDGEDVSSAELVRRLAEALGRPPVLLNIPPECLLLIGRFLGKQGAMERMLGSQNLDISEIRANLGWYPRYSMKEGFRATASWFRSS